MRKRSTVMAHMRHEIIEEVLYDITKMKLYVVMEALGNFTFFMKK